MNAGAAAKGKGAADAEQGQRVKERRTAEQRRTLGSRLERRKAAGADERRSCSGGVEPGGGEERWRKTKIPGDKNFNLRVVWYFFLF